MTERLFVYGTLAPDRPNAHMLETIGGSWEAGTVTGILRQEGWGAAMGNLGIDLDADGDEVAGFVFSSETLVDHWAHLDAFEGPAYERVLTIVRLADNRTVDAYITHLETRKGVSRNI